MVLYKCLACFLALAIFSSRLDSEVVMKIVLSKETAIPRKWLTPHGIFMTWNLLLCDSGLDRVWKNNFFRWVVVQARKAKIYHYIFQMKKVPLGWNERKWNTKTKPSTCMLTNYKKYVTTISRRCIHSYTI
jgi:hypothetical protein